MIMIEIAGIETTQSRDGLVLYALLTRLQKVFNVTNVRSVKSEKHLRCSNLNNLNIGTPIGEIEIAREPRTSRFPPRQ